MCLIKNNFISKDLSINGKSKNLRSVSCWIWGRAKAPVTASKQHWKREPRSRKPVYTWKTILWSRWSTTRKSAKEGKKQVRLFLLPPKGLIQNETRWDTLINISNFEFPNDARTKINQKEKMFLVDQYK